MMGRPVLGAALFWDDPRFVERFKGAPGVDEVAPYTCKLNLKRPRKGSKSPWHHDYPYWYAFAPQTAHKLPSIFTAEARRC